MPPAGKLTLALACAALTLFAVPPGAPSKPSTAPPSLAPARESAPPEEAARPARPAGNRPLPDAAGLERELGRFLGVLHLVESNAADPVEEEDALYNGAIPGMLRGLDPHSIFFNKDQFEQLQQMQRSVSKGFGSVVSVMPGRAIILQTQPGSPSQRAGLLAGDEILGVNDYALSQLDLEQLIQLLGASRQHPARLAVRRQGTAGLLMFTMIPAEMQAASVDRIYPLGDGVGYVRVTSFEPHTGEQLMDAIEQLGGKKLKVLVLDLRENPGGVVDAGFAAASFFLKPGMNLLTARGRSTDAQKVDVPAPFEPHYDCKLAVLVNSKTASAAEIVAGALQDHDRAVIVGEPTYGKGLVQRVFPLRDATGLALTIAFYYTPSGRSLQKPLRGSELEQATRAIVRPSFRTDAGRTVLGGGGIEPDVLADPETPSRFGVYLEVSGSFPAFATYWLSQHRGQVKSDLEITPALLDEFQSWLAEHHARPTVAEWTAERERLSARLQQEILNQSLGVAAGDEIEVRHDPAVLRALEKLGVR
jgi:carboxyl-terminal processing protease